MQSKIDSTPIKKNPADPKISKLDKKKLNRASNQKISEKAEKFEGDFPPDIQMNPNKP